MGKHTIWENIPSGSASEMTSPKARRITALSGSLYRIISPIGRTKEKARRGPPLERGLHTAGRFQLDDYKYGDGESGLRLGSLLTTEMTSDAFVCCPLRW